MVLLVLLHAAVVPPGGRSPLRQLSEDAVLVLFFAVVPPVLAVGCTSRCGTRCGTSSASSSPTRPAPGCCTAVACSRRSPVLRQAWPITAIAIAALVVLAVVVRRADLGVYLALIAALTTPAHRRRHLDGPRPAHLGPGAVRPRPVSHSPGGHPVTVSNPALVRPGSAPVRLRRTGTGDRRRGRYGRVDRRHPGQRRRPPAHRLVVAALLVPFSALLQRHGVPKWLAIVLALLSLVAGVALLVFLVVWRVSEQLPSLEDRTVLAHRQRPGAAPHPPMGLPSVDLDTVTTDARRSSSGTLPTAARGVVAGATLVHLGEGLFNRLVVTIFALIRRTADVGVGSLDPSRGPHTPTRGGGRGPGGPP